MKICECERKECAVNIYIYILKNTLINFDIKYIIIKLKLDKENPIKAIK